MPYKLINPIQDYVWGSRSELNRLFGISYPDDQPQAELWMGAHPNGSRLQPRPWAVNNAG